MPVAVLCRRYGEPEELEIAEVAPQPLRPDAVRIAVAAAGLNFPDLLVIRGGYQFKAPFPFSPGFECAGTVVEAGERVMRLKPGDRVCSHPWTGAMRADVVAPEALTFRIPDAMDFETAAGFPVAYGTMCHALIDRAELAPGRIVLVNGAAGGVGIAAIEIAKALGARVIAAARGGEKLALAAAHGADEMIDYGRESVRARVKALTGGAGADVIVDVVGGDQTDEAVRCIAWGGRLLIIGFAGGRIAEIPTNYLLIKGAEAVGVAYQGACNDDPECGARCFDRLLSWYGEAALRPHVSGVYPLADVAPALRAIEARRSTGKLVLRLD